MPSNEQHNRKGPAFLLKFSDGETPPVYQTIGGFRANAMSLAKGSALVTATGIFLGSAAETRARAAAMNGTLEDCQLSFEDGSRLNGKFLIQRLDFAGDFNGERNYRLELSGSEVRDA